MGWNARALGAKELRRVAAASAAVVITALSIGTGDAHAASCTLLCTTPTTDAPAPTTTTSTTAPASPPAPAPSPEHPTSAEAVDRLVARTNAERSERGLPALQVRGDVESIARGWSDSMAGAAELSHNDAYFTEDSHRRLDARLLGENVARAADVDSAHAALMASEPHRENILDARFTAVGIGASYVDGTWWITEDFLQSRSVGATQAASGQRAPVAPAPRPTRGTTASTSTTSTDTTATTAVERAGVAAAVAVPKRAMRLLPRTDRAPAGVLLRGEPATASRAVAGTLGATLLALLVIAVTGQLRRRPRPQLAMVIASPTSRH